MTTLKWTCSPTGSVGYAAARVALNQRVVDPELDGRLSRSASEINHVLAADELDAARFWRSIVAQGFDELSDAERCEAALRACGGSPLTIESTSRSIAGRLTDIRLSFQEKYPKLAEQLPLRARPLQAMWDERGRGLMRQLAAQTHASLIPQSVVAMLVQPVGGGGGDADPQSGRFWIEAMLTDAAPEVPEVLRVAWLVARVGVASPAANRMIDPEHLPSVAATALVPMVLSAGRELDLLRGDELPIDRAFALWDPNASEATVETLQRWWQQMQSGETPFPVGIKALDRMLYP